eukprot:1767724-Pleurochrysis_carterae.AAC.10
MLNSEYVTCTVAALAFWGDATFADPAARIIIVKSGSSDAESARLIGPIGEAQRARPHEEVRHRRVCARHKTESKTRMSPLTKKRGIRQHTQTLERRASRVMRVWAADTKRQRGKERRETT